jgi:hypothetical protein
MTLTDEEVDRLAKRVFGMSDKQIEDDPEIRSLSAAEALQLASYMGQRGAHFKELAEHQRAEIAKRQEGAGD